jgi:hypothetical protein
MRIGAAVFGMITLAAVAATSCASSTSTHGAQQSSRHGPLSDREFTLAQKIARREAAPEMRSVANATVTLRTGTVTDSNTGHQCLSRQLLDIKLVGDFPDIAVGGAGHQPGISTVADDRVHALLITADASTGLECLITVQTASPKSDPGAVVLFNR